MVIFHHGVAKRLADLTAGTIGLSSVFAKYYRFSREVFARRAYLLLLYCAGLFGLEGVPHLRGQKLSSWAV